MKKIAGKDCVIGGCPAVYEEYKDGDGLLVVGSSLTEDMGISLPPELVEALKINPSMSLIIVTRDLLEEACLNMSKKKNGEE